jgi:hypothetical protein
MKNGFSGKGCKHIQLHAHARKAAPAGDDYPARFSSP